MLIRVVHGQREKRRGTGGKGGPIVITDIGVGKVTRADVGGGGQCYVPYYKKSFKRGTGGASEVVEEISLPGYVDLVLTEALQLSLEGGQLRAYVDKGELEVVEIPSGARRLPQIKEMEILRTEKGGEVVLKGFGFVSYKPYQTVISGRVAYKPPKEIDPFEFGDLREPVYDPVNGEYVQAEIRIEEGCAELEGKKADAIYISNIPTLDALCLTLVVTANGKASEPQTRETS